MTSKAAQRELADTLEMFASQIRENADDRQNFLPSTWALDDWMEKYRDLHRHVSALSCRTQPLPTQHNA